MISVTDPAMVTVTVVVYGFFLVSATVAAIVTETVSPLQTLSSIATPNLKPLEACMCRRARRREAPSIADKDGSPLRT